MMYIYDFLSTVLALFWEKSYYTFFNFRLKSGQSVTLNLNYAHAQFQFSQHFHRRNYLK